MPHQAILRRLLIPTLLMGLLSPFVIGPSTAPVAAQEGPFLEPANPNASQNARQVLNYLASLPGRGRDRVIAGQHLGGGRSAASGYSQFVAPLEQATGQRVALIGGEYGHGRSPDAIAAENQVLIDQWNSGGLVSITFHADNPWTGRDAWDLTSRNLTELVTPGTAANRVWMAELDEVAAGLAQLRDAGVVVLWRPFHEMTFTHVFWWDSGAHPGNPAPFINLWRNMFDYFTYEKGLDNLLWVYSAGNNDSYNPVLEHMYPGDGYVDIVGIDIYNDTVYVGGNAYNKLLGLGKPFALTEFGPGTRNGSYDNMNTINRIRNRYPATTYVLQWSSWSGNDVAIVDNQNAGSFLNDDWVLTLDELDLEMVPSEDGIVIDNTDDRFSTESAQDDWQVYLDVGQNYGTTHLFNREIGSGGQDVARWSFEVPEPGVYEVYAWWWASDWRPPDVPYTIYHADGATTVPVDQRVNGAQWNRLGTFRFIDEGSVIVSDDVSSGQDIVADAIRVLYQADGPLLPPVPGPGEIIVDNTDPRFSLEDAQDSWQEYIDLGGQGYAGIHMFNRQTGSGGQDVARWSFEVPDPGVYEVYAWWWASDWRPPDVPYTIYHADGADTVRVDQRADGAQWNLLGTFRFDGEGSVVVSDDVSSGRDIVADAVRLVRGRQLADR